MNQIEELSYQMLSNIGEAKSCFIEAMAAARVNEINKAKSLIKEGEDHFTEGHKAHMRMTQLTDVYINLMVAHAEDQLMATDTIKIVAKEMIEVYKLIHSKL